MILFLHNVVSFLFLSFFLASFIYLCTVMSWNITHLAHYHNQNHASLCLLNHVARCFNTRAHVCVTKGSAMDAKKGRGSNNAQKFLSNDQKSVLHLLRAPIFFSFFTWHACSFWLGDPTSTFFYSLLFKRANTTILFTKVGNFCHVTKETDFINTSQKLQFLEKCFWIINSTKVSIHYKVAIIRHHWTSLVDGLYLVLLTVQTALLVVVLTIRKVTFSGFHDNLDSIAFITPL